MCDVIPSEQHQNDQIEPFQTVLPNANNIDHGRCRMRRIDGEQPRHFQQVSDYGKHRKVRMNAKRTNRRKHFVEGNIQQIRSNMRYDDNMNVETPWHCHPTPSLYPYTIPRKASSLELLERENQNLRREHLLLSQTLQSMDSQYIPHDASFDSILSANSFTSRGSTNSNSSFQPDMMEKNGNNNNM